MPSADSRCGRLLTPYIPATAAIPAPGHFIGYYGATAGTGCDGTIEDPFYHLASSWFLIGLTDYRLAATVPLHRSSIPRGKISGTGSNDRSISGTFSLVTLRKTRSIARPLAELLEKEGVRVWLDATELCLGDSLRRKIDDGLARSRYGVVVLSPAFFSKEWPQNELNGLFALESTRSKVILPVWHQVDQVVIARYSPLLADRLGISTALGIDRVRTQFLQAVRERPCDGQLASKTAYPPEVDRPCRVGPVPRDYWGRLYTYPQLES